MARIIENCSFKVSQCLIKEPYAAATIQERQGDIVVPLVRQWVMLHALCLAETGPVSTVHIYCTHLN